MLGAELKIVIGSEEFWIHTGANIGLEYPSKVQKYKKIILFIFSIWNPGSENLQVEAVLKIRKKKAALLIIYANGEKKTEFLVRQKEQADAIEKLKTLQF